MTWQEPQFYESYKVEVTPLYREGEYQSTSIDITEDVELNGIGDLDKRLDDADFDIGLFNYGYIDLSLLNRGGRYSSNNNSNSIFYFTRDNAQVDITFLDNQGNETAFFSGIIADDQTTQDLEQGLVNIRVLSRDAIFRRIQVKGGTLANGINISAALKSLLNRPAITNFLNYSDANINPAIDINIDIGGFFDGKSYRETLNSLMIACGSVLLVDENFNIIVRSREENSNLPYEFYNAGDLLGRTNIEEIVNFRSGLNRAFNAFIIDDVSSVDEAYSNRYGYNKKELKVEDFITNAVTRKTITDFYLAEYKVPKREFDIVVKTSLIKDIKILDRLTCGIFPIYKTSEGDTLPLYEQMEYGKTKFPFVLSDEILSDSIGFKVIGINNDTSSLFSMIKVREIGKTFDDNELDFLTIGDEYLLFGTERILIE